MGSGKAVASASKVPSKSKGRNGQSRDRRVSRGCVPDQTTRDAMNRLEGKPWVADHTQGDSEQSFVSTPLAPDLHSHDDETFRVEAVVAELTRRAKLPSRRTSAPLYFAFDHCFQVRGQGTVLTGTVLTGEVKVSSDAVDKHGAWQGHLVIAVPCICTISRRCACDVHAYQCRDYPRKA